jgi:glycosyltransferase involved in cell wall biosynthesis
LNKRINNKPIVIYIGGGSYIKGFEMFLETILKALIKGLDIKVYITYGRSMSPKEEALLKRISRNLGNKLVLLGRLSYNEYLKLHEAAWALLFPSIWEEPLPYAIIESMLLGTIPIASRVGGVPEIIRGSPAEEYLFTPGDINEFIDRIEKLLSQSKKDIIDIGIKLREHILRLLNEEKIENKLVSLFKSLIS